MTHPLRTLLVVFAVSAGLVGLTLGLIYLQTSTTIPLDNLELGLNVNNLFNTLGYRAGGSLTSLSATSGIFSNSAVTGRTMTASVRYSF